jgi:class 3 adenylate cyclase
VPNANDDHAVVALELARDMLNATEAFGSRAYFDMRLRIGIHSGVFGGMAAYWWISDGRARRSTFCQLVSAAMIAPRRSSF